MRAKPRDINPRPMPTDRTSQPEISREPGFTRLRAHGALLQMMTCILGRLFRFEAIA